MTIACEFIVERMRSGDGVVTLAGTPENTELGRDIVRRVRARSERFARLRHAMTPADCSSW